MFARRASGLQGADRGGYRRINIGASGGQDLQRKGGIIAAAVLGVKHKTEIEKLRFVLVNACYGGSNIKVFRYAQSG
jgi:hypothetical protein